jgi:hypothetical protein
MRLPALLAAVVLGVAAPAVVGVPASAAPADPARTAALERILQTRRLKNVSFKETSFDDFLTYMRIATGLNFMPKQAVLKKADIDTTTIKVTIQLDDVTVATVLELALDAHALVAKPEGNIVFVTTKADALGPPVLVIYPTSHLTWTKTDFVGPDIDLHPSNYTPIEDPVEEKVVEDDPFSDPQHIVDLVKQMVDAPWDTEGWSIVANKQFMTVKAPRTVQARVAVAMREIATLK